MALNQLMHPRNPFKTKKPDFAMLADKYEAFGQQTTRDSKGKVHIDFKNPACLKTLTWALLKEEYDVNVEIPSDRLIPTVPLRINYILWLEDIFCGHLSLKGIDIGTGAVCVYPIIGAKKNGWSFLATEADATNLEYARKNVQQNDLSDKIKVVKAGGSSSLLDILQDSDETYDFCMCNPPFFASNLEAWGILTTRSTDRPEPSSVNTASPVECIAPGGEVEFIRDLIINSSLILRNRIRVYTSMLGKKSSLSKIKEILRENKITNFGSSEFCQGNTMRWGIAWSFDETIQFPKPASKMIKMEKPRPPLVLNLPLKFDGKSDGCMVMDVAKLVEKMLLDLKVSLIEKTDDAQPPCSKSWLVTSVENTWAHQRRKRRRLAREQSGYHVQGADGGELNEKNGTAITDTMGERRNKEDDEPPAKQLKEKRLDSCRYENDYATDNIPAVGTEGYQSKELNEAAVTQAFCVAENTENQSTKYDQAGLADDSVSQLSQEIVFSEPNSDGQNRVVANQQLPLLKCLMTILQVDSGIAIHFDWIDGQNREYMHQLMQYLKNRIK